MRLSAVLTLLIGLTLAACAPSSDNRPTEPTSRPLPTMIPTAESWQPARTPMTQDSIQKIIELGRLMQPEPPGTLFSTALSIDDSMIAGISNDFIMAWELETGHRLLTVDRRSASSVFFGPDRLEIYTLGVDGEIRIIDSQDGSPIMALTAIEGFSGVSAYDPIGGWLALGDNDGNIQIWDMPAHGESVVLDGPDVPIIALAFSPDGKTLVAADANGSLYHWDFIENSLIRSIHLLINLYEMAYAPSGDYLALSTDEGILISEIETLEVVYQLTDATNGGMFAFMGERDMLISGGQNTDFTLWNVPEGKLLAAFPSSAGNRPHAAISPDGNILITSTRRGAVLWNVSQVASGTILRGSISLPPMDAIRVIWTGDSLQLILLEAIGTIRIFGIP